MLQTGFFDLETRHRDLDAKGDPLVRIDDVIRWEDSRAETKAAWRMAPEARKSKAGRPPWDEIVMFKAIILAELYDLSDDQG